VDDWLISSTRGMVIPVGVSHLLLRGVALSPLSFAALGSLKDLTYLSMILSPTVITEIGVSVVTLPALGAFSLEVISTGWDWADLWP
jgi:hypothetical protein